MNECVVYVNRVWPAFGVMGGAILHLDFLHTVSIAVVLNVMFLVCSLIFQVCFYLPLHFKRILLTILTCPPHILTF